MYKFFVVSYDLHLNKDYPKLEKSIEQISIDWVKPLESFYLIKTTFSVTQIRDTLKKSTDNDDSIFVMRANLGEWATSVIKRDVTDKIKNWG